MMPIIGIEAGDSCSVWRASVIWHNVSADNVFWWTHERGLDGTWRQR
jgi:hypothetical protein